jgi:hypothetical protein
MNVPLPSHRLIGHWVPGMLVLMVAALSRSDWKYTAFLSTYAKDAPSVTLTTILFFILAFVIGEFLDSLRDLLEHVWDRISPVNWDYLATSPSDQAEQFRNYYWTYYVLAANLVYAFVLSLLMTPFRFVSWPPWPLPVFAVLGVCVFLWNAITLRREIAHITHRR